MVAMVAMVAMAAMWLRRNVRVGLPRSLHRRGGYVGRRSFLGLLAAALALAPVAITAPASSSQELTPIPVKTTDRPIFLLSAAADGEWFGWTRYDDSTGSQNYFVQRGTRPRLRVNPKGTTVDGGGIYRHTLVYAQYSRRQRLAAISLS